MHPAPIPATVRPMNKAEMAKEEKKWAAQHDLRTLIEAERIKKDKTRFNAALKAHAEAVKDMAKVQKEEAAAVDTIKADAKK
jgi:hypothetical protein